MSSKQPVDIHQVVTDSIIASIEAGAGTWEMPWHRGGGICSSLPKNITGRFYNGINVLALWAIAEARGYDHGLFGTYRQWAEAGAQVRKGEKSSMVVFYREFQAEADPEDPGDDGMRRMARATPVFNVAQVDGYAMPSPPPLLPPIERLERVDAFLKATGAKVLVGGNRAYYSLLTDHVQLPAEGLFHGNDVKRMEAMYAVSFHEHGHWTGHANRLNREFGKRFGDDKYAAEELVAELVSGFLCAELGISAQPRPDHAQYIDLWLRILRTDKKAVFTAAAKASEAVRYLSAFSAKEQDHAKAA